jgi:hypothetical protein
MNREPCFCVTSIMTQGTRPMAQTNTVTTHSTYSTLSFTDITITRSTCTLHSASMVRSCTFHMSQHKSSNLNYCEVN